MSLAIRTSNRFSTSTVLAARLIRSQVSRRANHGVGRPRTLSLRRTQTVKFSTTSSALAPEQKRRDQHSVAEKSQQGQPPPEPRKGSPALRTYRDYIKEVDERIIAARTTIKDPARMEREMERLFAEREIHEERGKSMHPQSSMEYITAMVKLFRILPSFVRLCMRPSHRGEVSPKSWALVVAIVATFLLCLTGPFVVIATVELLLGDALGAQVSQGKDERR